MITRNDVTITRNDYEYRGLCGRCKMCDIYWCSIVCVIFGMSCYPVYLHPPTRSEKQIEKAEAVGVVRIGIFVYLSSIHMRSCLSSYLYLFIFVIVFISFQYVLFL